MTELLVGHQEGTDRAGRRRWCGRFRGPLRAFPGEPVDYAMRDPVSQRVIATVTSPFYGPKIWYADDPAGEWDAGRRGRAARRQRRGARADLGDRGRRGRLAVRRRRSGRAVREPRRRADLGAQPLVATGTASTGTGSRAAAGCACTRSCPGRASPTSCRWQCRPPGCGTPTTAARPGARATRGSSPATCPMTRARAPASFASTGWNAPPAGPSGCSSSSTVAFTAPTTPADPGARSARACPRTSASR